MNKPNDFNKSPIQTEKEASQVFRYITKSIVKVHNITIEEAEKRVIGLKKSGILNMGTFDDPKVQLAIDIFLAVPSSEYSHLQ